MKQNTLEHYFAVQQWIGSLVGGDTFLALFQDMISSHVDYSRASLNDLLYGLLKFEPLERLTAREALNHPFFENPT